MEASPINLERAQLFAVLLLVWGQFLPFFLFAQEKEPSFFELKGLVTDAQTKAPLPFATVIGRNGKTNQMLRFATTQENGAFELSLPFADSLYAIEVRHLGYGTKKLWFLPDSLPSFLQIALSPQETVIKEVIVRSEKPPVQIKGDTTQFNTDAFLTGSEETIEQLIGKLPGFRVQDDGGISYKGKEVKAVMLDGDDLLGKDYKVATRTLRASLLESIQAIENYHSNPLLKGIEQGKGTVVNLQVKQQYQQLLFGNVSFAYGLSNKREGFSNLLSYGHRVKSYFYLSHNTTGQDLGPITKLEGSLDELREQIAEMSEGQTSFYESDLAYSGFFKKEWQNFNRQAAVKGTSVVRFSDKASAKVNASAVTDRNALAVENTSTYFPLEPPVSFESRAESLKKPQQLKIGSEWVWKTSAKSRFFYENELFRPSTHLIHQYRFGMPGETNEAFGEDYHAHQEGFRQKMEFTYRLGAKAALVATLKQHTIDQSKSHLFVGGNGQFSGFFEKNPPMWKDSLFQELDNSLSTWLAEVKLPFKTRHFVGKIQSGHSLKKEQVSLNQQLNNQTVTDPSASRFQVSHSFTSVKLERDFKALSVMGKGQLSYYNFHLVNTDKNSRQQLIWLPEVQLKYRLAKTFAAKLLYEKQASIPPFATWFASTFFTSFRTAQRGVDQVVIPQQHVLSFSVEQDQPSKGQRINVGVQHLIKRNSYQPQREITESLDQQSFFVLDRATVWRFRSSFNRFFDDLKLNLYGACNLEVGQSANQLNQENQAITTQQAGCEGGIGWVGTGIVTLGLNGQWNRFAFKTSTNRSFQFEKTELRFYSNFNIKHVQGQFDQHMVLISGTSYWFANLKISYSFKEKASLFLIARNLYNTSGFRSIIATEINADQQQFDFQPIMVLAGLAINF